MAKRCNALQLLAPLPVLSLVLRTQKSIHELNADAGGCAVPACSNGAAVPEKDRGQRPVSPSTVSAIVTASANNSNINYEETNNNCSSKIKLVGVTHRFLVRLWMFSCVKMAPLVLFQFFRVNLW